MSRRSIAFRAGVGSGVEHLVRVGPPRALHAPWTCESCALVDGSLSIDDTHRMSARVFAHGPLGVGHVALGLWRMNAHKKTAYRNRRSR